MKSQNRAQVGIPKHYTLFTGLFVMERQGSESLPSEHAITFLTLQGSLSVCLLKLTHTFSTRRKHINQYLFACAFYW